MNDEKNLGVPAEDSGRSTPAAGETPSVRLRPDALAHGAVAAKRLPTIRRRNLTIPRKLGLLQELYDASFGHPWRKSIIHRAMVPLESMQEVEELKHRARLFNELRRARTHMENNRIRVPALRLPN